MNNTTTHTYKMCDMRIYKPVGKKWELVYWWTSLRSIAMEYWTKRWYATMGYQMDFQEFELIFSENVIKGKREQAKCQEERWNALVGYQLTDSEGSYERSNQTC